MKTYKLFQKFVTIYFWRISFKKQTYAEVKRVGKNPIKRLIKSNNV